MFMKAGSTYLLRVRRVQVKKLRDDEVGHVVVDSSTEADNTLRDKVTS